jgi:hypothetical protein
VRDRAFKFDAAPEQLRKPRVVKIGLIQNSIAAPTTAPLFEQVPRCLACSLSVMQP